VGAAPALAESTASVELIGKAEGAIAAKTEALVPWAQDVAAREVEKLPQKTSKANEPPLEALPQKGERNPEALSRKRELEGRPNGGEREPVWLPREALREALRQSGRELDAPSRVDRKGVAGRMHEALPPEVEHERGATPQGKAEHEPVWPPREPSREDVLSIWEGPGPWDPGGRSPREHNFKSKRPVEPWEPHRASTPTTKRRSGIIARKTNQEKPGRSKYHWQVGGTSNRNNHVPLPIHHRPIPSSRSRSVFVLRPAQRARHRPGRCRGRDIATRNRNAAVWWPSHNVVTRAPAPHITYALAQQGSSTRGRSR